MVSASMIYSCGCTMLFQAISSEHQEHVLNFFPEKFPEQRWYVVASWLLGIAIGEIVVRVRKPSSTPP
jgi:hypothetical protein